MGYQREDAPQGLQGLQGQTEERREPEEMSATGEFERALRDYENAQNAQNGQNTQNGQAGANVANTSDQTPPLPERQGAAFPPVAPPSFAPSLPQPHIDEFPTGRLTAPPVRTTDAPTLSVVEAPDDRQPALEPLETLATEPVSAVAQPQAIRPASEPPAALSFTEVETDRLPAPVTPNAPNMPNTPPTAPEPPVGGGEQRQPKITRPIAEERFDPFDPLPQPWDDALAAEQAAPTGAVDSGVADLPTARLHTAPPAFGAPRLESPDAAPAVPVDEETTLPPRAPRPRPTAPPAAPTPWNADAWVDQRDRQAPAQPIAPTLPKQTTPEQPQLVTPSETPPNMAGRGDGAPAWGHQSLEQASPRWATPPATYGAPSVGYPSAGPMTMSERTPVLQRPTPALAPPSAPAPGAPPSSPWRRPTGAPGETLPSPQETQTPPAAPAPARRKGGASRVAIVALVVALVVAALGVGGAYFYGQQQAKAPTRLVNAYCAALTQANYSTAYRLFLPAYQASISQQQYVADQLLRDQLFGRVTSCSASLASQAGMFIFWRQPSLEVFDVTLKRAGAPSEKHAAATLHGQVTLAPNGATWLIGAVDLSLQSVDLDPLTPVNGFCSAMVAHDYAKAYSWLSPPYQQEQGGEPAFAQSFGATLGITKCDPQPQTLTVSSNDRVATMQVTLSGYGAPPLTIQTSPTPSARN